jgi:hypothetical protein
MRKDNPFSVGESKLRRATDQKKPKNSSGVHRKLKLIQGAASAMLFPVIVIHHDCKRIK